MKISIITGARIQNAIFPLTRRTPKNPKKIMDHFFIEEIQVLNARSDLRTLVFFETPYWRHPDKLKKTNMKLCLV